MYIFAIFYLLYNNAYLVSTYSLPTNLIPIISLISALYIGYNYFSLYLKVDSLEYEFSSIVNHTFRTPLTRIMWFTKELEKDMSQNERLLFLQNITNATSRVLEIVDLIVGIKNVNNTFGYFFEAISIRTVVEKSIINYREEINKKEIKFQVPTFKDMPLLTVDLKKISFVIDTLIENAIWYTPRGGQIVINCVADANKMTLSVADNGLGLDFMDKLKIFTRFYRNKQALKLNTDGMGLRLYLSKQIIKRHHGRIYAKSAGVNKGSTFFVELPFN